MPLTYIAKNSIAEQVPVQVGQEAHSHGQYNECCMGVQEVYRLFMASCSLTVQVLFSSGDALAQQVVDRRGWAKHDLARSGRMALYGGGRSFDSVAWIMVSF